MHLKEGVELKQLKQMGKARFDEDILDDLGLDNENKTKAHEQLRALQQLR